jgi:S-DNA-T family DNA segregation ATPase FtsK/SpoIIIE
MVIALAGGQGAGVAGQAYVRFWYVTVPATFLTWLYLQYGWVGLVAVRLDRRRRAAGGSRTAVVAAVRVVAVLARWRRFVYRRRWTAAMVTAKLRSSFDKHTVIPVLKRVRCRAGRTWCWCGW